MSRRTPYSPLRSGREVLVFILCMAVLMGSLVAAATYGPVPWNQTATRHPALIPPAFARMPPPGSAAGCTLHHTGCAGELLTLINHLRRDNGRGPLALSWPQSRGAGTCVGSRGHSRAMAASGAIWHSAPDDDPNQPTNPASFPRDICLPFTAAAENVSQTGPSDEWGAIENGLVLMLQEPYAPGCSGNHHCTLLSADYRTIGIGLWYENGLMWLTMDFTG